MNDKRPYGHVPVGTSQTGYFVPAFDEVLPRAIPALRPDINFSTALHNTRWFDETDGLWREISQLIQA
jgi:hypothetical protein